MYTVNNDLSIYVTRGDAVLLAVGANNNGVPYVFQPGEVVRFRVFEKKGCHCTVLQKDFIITDAVESVEIVLTKNETKIGEIVSKPKDYWYEIELNPDYNPQTIVGYDDDGPKLFRLFPEGADTEGGEGEAPDEFVPAIEGRFLPYVTEADNGKTVAVVDGEWKLAQGMGVVNVRDCGAVGDGVTDDTEAFKAAVNSGKNVFIPSGTYLLTDFSVDTKCIITGENKNTTRLECNGISLNAEAEISQVHIEQRDTTKTAVLVNKSGCYVHECNIYCGNIGLELAAAKHIIGGVFRNLTIGYCKHAGVKAIASGNGQKNQILYEHLYIVNTGENTQDSSAPSTELENGFGMYIDGGYGVEIRNCVFEYNSGVGLYLGMTYPLWGCNVTSPYFEYNKYAQLYINNIDGTYMKNVHVSGDFYTDAGRSLPANSLKNRGMCLRLNTNLTSNESVQGNHFSSESGKTIAFNNRYCPNNLFPFDVIGEMKSDYIPLADYNGETVMEHGKGYHTLHSVPIHVEKGEYTVSVDLSTDGANTDWFGFYLVGHPDGSKAYTIHSHKMGKDGSWNTVSFDVSFNGVGVCSVQTNNNSSNYPVYIKNIRIVKKDAAVEARFAEIGTKFAEVDDQFAEINTKLNANRYCQNNLFPFDVIGEAAGTDIVGGTSGITLGEYNGETVWTMPTEKGLTVYPAPIYVEKGDYQLTFEIATVEGNNDLLLFGLSSHPDGSKVGSNRATTEWITVTNNISFTKTGTCYLYAWNKSATNPFYIKNIRIVRLYPAAPTA